MDFLLPRLAQIIVCWANTYIISKSKTEAIQIDRNILLHCECEYRNNGSHYLLETEYWTSREKKNENKRHELMYERIM